MSRSVRNMVADTIDVNLNDAMKEKDYVGDLDELQAVLAPYKGLFVREEDFRPSVVELNSYTKEYLSGRLKEMAWAYLDEKEKRFGLFPGTDMPLMRELERVILLRVVDEYWMEHIDAMDDLRRGIGLRGYGNTKPIDAYKQEGFEMFDAMINGIKAEVSRRILVTEIKRPEEGVQRKRVAKESLNNVGGETGKQQPIRKTKIGRNQLCPCGSGKKYKYCHGRDR